MTNQTSTRGEFNLASFLCLESLYGAVHKQTFRREKRDTSTYTLTRTPFPTHTHTHTPPCVSSLFICTNHDHTRTPTRLLMYKNAQWMKHNYKCVFCFLVTLIYQEEVDAACPIELRRNFWPKLRTPSSVVTSPL